MDEASNIAVQGTPAPPAERATPRLRSPINILCALILIAEIIWVCWSLLSSHRLDWVDWPEYELPLVVGRMMEVKEAVKGIPVWEQRLYKAMLADSPNDLPLAISWYEELASYSQAPQVKVELAILEGETGRMEQLRRRIAVWERKEVPPEVIRLIEAAYLDPPQSSPSLNKADLKLLEEIDPAWFRDRIETRLNTGIAGRAPPLPRGISSRSQRTLSWLRSKATIEIAITLGGVFALFCLLIRGLVDPKTLRVGTAPIPPPWSEVAATIVLLRWAAFWTLANMAGGLLTNTMEFNSPLPSLCVSILITCVLIALIQEHLLKPQNLELKQVLGLSSMRTNRSWLFFWVVALLTASLLGDWLITQLSERLGLFSHWTESFDSDLVWGKSISVIFVLLHMGLFGPILEEFVFRGLLFTTFRKRFHLVTAATLSASIFAFIHGYGIVGFLTVAWSGFLWAWAYEKTKSLLPVILAHGIQNLIYGIGLILLYRQ